jgi:hypothetical protein
VITPTAIDRIHSAATVSFPLFPLQTWTQDFYVRIYFGFRNTCFQLTSLYTYPSSSTSGCLSAPDEPSICCGPVIKGLAGSSGGSRDLRSCGMGEAELGYRPPAIFRADTLDELMLDCCSSQDVRVHRQDSWMFAMCRVFLTLVSRKEAVLHWLAGPRKRQARCAF